ncbi:unnamed protein product [Cylindrotheca closterium]|uniref:ER membrane protein complex subunit 3 n=1 Tax=Cylindrotheca closterium TaxID=2856 RepID=A0AAD2CEC4_9STRA|nr:unnamed protein product [Cylindrotheca closterium]
MSTAENILLDSDIRDWVVLPLFVIMVAAGLLRFHMGNVLKPDPKQGTKVTQRIQSSVRAVAILKGGAVHFLSTSKLESRKLAYPKLLRAQAIWCENHLDEQDAAGEKNGGENDDGDMPNPFSSMEGMMGNMAFMVQNMIMMQAIQHFFSGFILLKVPFRLTLGFKQMFQRGLEGLATLETSYVSSISWYFLVMFGLRGFFKLAIGSPALETQETHQAWQKLGKQPPGRPGTTAGAADDDKQIEMLEQEADNLEMLLPTQFKSNLDQVEKRLLQNNYPKKKSTIAKNDFLLHHSVGKNKSKKN